LKFPAKVKPPEVKHCGNQQHHHTATVSAIIPFRLRNAVTDIDELSYLSILEVAEIRARLYQAAFEYNHPEILNSSTSPDTK
jgi:hypothetical protein